MYARIATALVVVAVALVTLALAYPQFTGLVVDWCRPTDTRTQAQKTIDANAKQLKMLTEHRALFEAVAKGDPARTAELRAKLNIDFGQDGPRFHFSWHNGGGALFGCMLVLYYCPNGERDLPEGFFKGPSYKTWYHPMKIDEHWFTAAQNCG